MAPLQIQQSYQRDDRQSLTLCTVGKTMCVILAKGIDKHTDSRFRLYYDVKKKRRARHNFSLESPDLSQALKCMDHHDFTESSLGPISSKVERVEPQLEDMSRFLSGEAAVSTCAMVMGHFPRNRPLLSHIAPLYSH